MGLAVWFGVECFEAEVYCSGPEKKWPMSSVETIEIVNTI